MPRHCAQLCNALEISGARHLLEQLQHGLRVARPNILHSALGYKAVRAPSDDADTLQVLGVLIPRPLLAVHAVGGLPGRRDDARERHIVASRHAFHRVCAAELVHEGDARTPTRRRRLALGAEDEVAHVVASQGTRLQAQHKADGVHDVRFACVRQCNTQTRGRSAAMVSTSQQAGSHSPRGAQANALGPTMHVKLSKGPMTWAPLYVLKFCTSSRTMRPNLDTDASGA